MADATVPLPETHKHACILCARRKVKCDRLKQCSNCQRAKVECAYQPPAPSRPRKRPVDDELVLRLQHYEDLLRKHNIDMAPQKASISWPQPSPEYHEPKLDIAGAAVVSTPRPSPESELARPEEIEV